MALIADSRQQGSAQPGSAVSQWTLLETRLGLRPTEVSLKTDLLWPGLWLSGDGRTWQVGTGKRWGRNPQQAKTMCRAGIFLHPTLWIRDFFRPNQRWLCLAKWGCSDELSIVYVEVEWRVFYGEWTKQLSLSWFGKRDNDYKCAGLSFVFGKTIFRTIGYIVYLLH